MSLNTDSLEAGYLILISKNTIQRKSLGAILKEFMNKYELEMKKMRNGTNFFE